MTLRKVEIDYITQFGLTQFKSVKSIPPQRSKSLFAGELLVPNNSGITFNCLKGETCLPNFTPLQDEASHGILS